ncbi:alpha/beta hydrolase [Anaerotardibacter muris]|uniref:alpha/beta hydrolase n=1 Tax=Anaerotardibacter muris TaxID=2941505 RepID=UPI00203ED18B|nr:alpha/beta hydrolase [Anaerotardibacter muris]
MHMDQIKTIDSKEGITEMEFNFPSWDGESNIRALLWVPEREPRGIVQLIHGMSEHIERYDPFARYLAERGFVVCGHDHIGHGKSAGSRSNLGHMPVNTGADVLVEDVDSLRSIMTSAFSDHLPYFIFGHSMGSFTLRVYLTRHGEGLAGAILCGTGQKPRLVSLAGNAVAKLAAKLRGERAKSDFLHSMADGAFSKQVEDPRTEFDWISADPGNVDAYINDDLTGFSFTLGGYASLTRLTLLAADLELAKKIPNSLPLLFIAGANDPVGENGKGVQAAADLMRKAGAENVEVVLYDGMRHEILNEADAAKVFSDVATWLNGITRDLT